MSGSARVGPVLGLLGLFACADDTTGLDASVVDAGPQPLEYCEGSYYDLDSQGQIRFEYVPCARGSVCGNGLDYDICVPGEARASGFGGGVVYPDVVRRAMNELPGYPWCDQTEPTASGDRCLFTPGCDNPRGRWCRNLVCGSGDIVAITACEEEPSCQLVYCGCDGETYEGLPFYPYAHPGPCP